MRFTDLGPYRIDVMPEVSVRLLVNSTVSESLPTPYRCFLALFPRQSVSPGGDAGVSETAACQ